MNKPIVFDIDLLIDNGFNCYIKGRSYDLGENNKEVDPLKAVYYYKKGFYEYNDILCQYSIAISNYLNEFQSVFNDNDKLILFPSIDLIENYSNDNIKKIYSNFVKAAYYNYGFDNIVKDEKRAFELIKECANMGHVGAMYDLGTVPKFVEQIDNSFDYLKIASLNGSLRAQNKINKLR